METRVLLLALIVTVSGCTQLTGPNQKSNNDLESEAVGKGLEILSFEATDNEIYPGQKTVVILRMKNHHIDPIDMQQMELYNYAPLELLNGDESLSDRCNPGEIKPAKYGDSRLIECRWKLRAPEDGLGPFKSKNVNLRLQMRYLSRLSNKKNALQVQFTPYDRIDSSRQLERTYSNEEVELRAKIESPAPLDGTKVGLKFSDVGSGKVLPMSETKQGDVYYNLEILPDSIRHDCSTDFGEGSSPGKGFDIKSPIGPSIETSCEISVASSSQVVRNLIFATSYKYQQSSSLDIEVVKDQ